MKSSKKKNKAGPNIFDSIFLHEFVDITVSVLQDSSKKFVVRGMLLDQDEKHYYIGDMEDGVRMAVAKNKVLVIELYEEVQTIIHNTGNESH